MEFYLERDILFQNSHWAEIIKQGEVLGSDIRLTLKEDLEESVRKFPIAYAKKPLGISSVVTHNRMLF